MDSEVKQLAASFHVCSERSVHFSKGEVFFPPGLEGQHALQIIPSTEMEKARRA